MSSMFHCYPHFFISNWIVGSAPKVHYSQKGAIYQVPTLGEQEGKKCRTFSEKVVVGVPDDTCDAGLDSSKPYGPWRSLTPPGSLLLVFGRNTKIARFFNCSYDPRTRHVKPTQFLRNDSVTQEKNRRNQCAERRPPEGAQGVSVTTASAVTFPPSRP